MSCYSIHVGRFADAETKAVYDGNPTKGARRRLPIDLHRSAALKITRLLRSPKLSDLRVPPGNRLEELKGARKGYHSIRIDKQYRIVFRWTDGGADEIMIEDYH